MARYTMEMDLGATMQYGFALYILDEDGVTKDYLLPPEVTTVAWKLRSSDNTYYHVYELILEGDVWKLHLAPTETAKFSPHKSYFYSLDAVYPSGDAFRYLEGPVFVRPLGGYDGRDNIR